MATLASLMKESEKLKFQRLQEKMLEAPKYLTSLSFKLRADGVLYLAERRIRREAKERRKRKNGKGC